MRLELKHFAIPGIGLIAVLAALALAIPFVATAARTHAQDDPGAFAFRKQDKRLLKKWNEALTGFVGSQEHLQLISQFEFAEREIPTIQAPLPTANSSSP